MTPSSFLSPQRDVSLNIHLKIAFPLNLLLINRNLVIRLNETSHETDGFEFFSVKKRKDFLRTDYDTTPALLSSFRVINLSHFVDAQLLKKI